MWDKTVFAQSIKQDSCILKYLRTEEKFIFSLYFSVYHLESTSPFRFYNLSCGVLEHLNPPPTYKMMSTLHCLGLWCVTPVMTTLFKIASLFRSQGLFLWWSVLFFFFHQTSSMRNSRWSLCHLDQHSPGLWAPRASVYTNETNETDWRAKNYTTSPV